MKKFFIITSLFLFTLAPLQAKVVVPQKSVFEIRNIQTRTFDTNDEFKVTKAVINTLQDNGFIIQMLEPELGYIRAKKEVKLKRTERGRVVLYGTLMSLDTALIALTFGTSVDAMLDLFQNSMRMKNEIAPHTVIFDSNVNIEKFGKKTRVRFCVIEKILENADGYTTVKSSPRKVVRHLEPEIFQEFFNQVGKNLFLEKAL